MNGLLGSWCGGSGGWGEGGLVDGEDGVVSVAGVGGPARVPATGSAQLVAPRRVGTGTGDGDRRQGGGAAQHVGDLVAGQRRECAALLRAEQALGRERVEDP